MGQDYGTLNGINNFVNETRMYVGAAIQELEEALDMEPSNEIANSIIEALGQLREV